MRDALQRRTTARLSKLAVAALVAALGTAILYQPIIGTGFARVPGDVGDARFVNLVLEHCYRYLAGTLPHQSFWSPAWIFYPVPNGLAMSDVMLGSVWLYAPFRAFLGDPLGAFQWWLIAASLLNFAAVALLFRRLGATFWGWLPAAFVYAFGMPRAAFSNHPQLTPSFYIPLALLCLWELFKSERIAAQIALAAGAAMLVAMQFWSSFYLGWFFILSFLVGALVAGASRHRRAVGLRALRARIAALGVGAAVFALAVGPLALHYLDVAATHGQRSWSEALSYAPEVRALIVPHPGSWLYGPLFGRAVRGVQNYSEKLFFSGFATLLAPGIIIYLRRRRLEQMFGQQWSLAGLAAALTLALCALTLKFPGGVSLWCLPFWLLPGGRAIRAVGRMIHLIMIPQTLCLAFLLTILARRQSLRWTLVAVALAALAVAENLGTYDYSYPRQEHDGRVAALEAKLKANASGCDAFYAVGPGEPYAVQIDAMWASLATGLPTINGYSGFSPHGFDRAGLDVPAHATTAGIDAWRQLQGIADKRVCLIQY